MNVRLDTETCPDFEIFKDEPYFSIKLQICVGFQASIPNFMTLPLFVLKLWESGIVYL